MVTELIKNYNNNKALEAKRTKDNICMSPKAWAEKFKLVVLDWFNTHGRAFPWRTTSNPFHILVAEILLRQTQANRVAGPYQELISRYPDVNTLAEADVEELRDWFRPLGLFKRADYLVKAAKEIVDNYCGEVPNNIEALLQLPGVGIYSARAVHCLAFGSSVPMIDESSGRLLRRVLGLEYKGPAFADRRLFEKVEVTFAGTTTKSFNLGLLDLAAQYCRPKSPDCHECPLYDLCAHTKNIVRNTDE